MRMMVTVPTVLVLIALAAITIALFVARHLTAYAVSHVVAVAIAFVGRGQREIGGKSNGGGNEKGDGNVGNRDGDSDKEGEGESSKRNGDGG